MPADVEAESLVSCRTRQTADVLGVRFQHCDRDTGLGQQVGGGQAGRPGSDYDRTVRFAQRGSLTAAVAVHVGNRPGLKLLERIQAHLAVAVPHEQASDTTGELLHQ